MIYPFVPSGSHSALSLLMKLNVALSFFFFLFFKSMQCDWYISTVIRPKGSQQITFLSHAKCKFLIIVESLFPVSNTEDWTKGHKTCW